MCAGALPVNEGSKEPHSAPTVCTACGEEHARWATGAMQSTNWCGWGARYLLRVTVTRGYGASVVKDFPFWVRNYGTPPETSNLPPIKVRSAVPACGFVSGFVHRPCHPCCTDDGAQRRLRWPSATGGLAA